MLDVFGSGKKVHMIFKHDGAYHDPKPRHLLPRCSMHFPRKRPRSWRCYGPGASDGSAEDWQVYFDERAGIAEFDGGLPRAEAEARAFECCVVERLNRNFCARAAGTLRQPWRSRAEPRPASAVRN